MMFRSSVRVFACLLLVSALIVACDSTGDMQQNSPPQAIEPEAFEFGVDSFPSLDSNARPAKSGTHVTVAATTVGLLSGLIAANLALPKAVTAAALQAEPTMTEGTWTWESTAQFNQSTATFRLEGTPEREEVEWSMFVTASSPALDGELQNFNLYTGTTARDTSSGSYSLFYPIDGERKKVLSASFNVDSETKKVVRFTVAEGARQNVGDSIRYSVNGTTRQVVILTADAGGQVIINWDAETKAGSITAPKYNNGQKACWGPAPDLENVPCDE